MSYQSVAAWSDFTTAEFAVRTVAGDHFYVTKAVDELVADVEQRILELPVGSG